MALKDEVPAFKVGSPDLGGQLRALAAVVLALCEAQEAASKAPAAAESTAVTKPASKPATRVSAK